MKTNFKTADIRRLQIPAQSEAELKFQVSLLSYLVIELLREVEILRQTQIDEAQKQGISPKHSAYGENYREISLWIQSSVGPGGLVSFFKDWISDKTTRNGLAVTEFPMLEKLGYTSEEIEEYLEKVEEVSIYT
jgi:hypothetical protein